MSLTNKKWILKTRPTTGLVEASNNLSDKFMSFFGSPEWSPKSN